MKILREGQPPILIGKRVVLGQLILAFFNVGAGLHDWMNPENTVPAALVGFLAQAVTGIVQIWVVNKWGVTTDDEL